MKHLTAFILITLACATSTSFAATNDFFAQGLSEYRGGDFPEAAKAFAQSATKLLSTGALLNLGITEWQRGHAGAAILAWEQAHWINPFDRSANDNLEFARRVAQVNEPSLKWFEIPSVWLPANGWVWLAGFGLWLAVGAVTLPGLFRRRKSDRQQTLAALGLGIFLFCFTANLGVISRTQIGFIVKKDAPLLLTPTSESETITTLADGEPVRRLRRHGNYWLVQTGNGIGWIGNKNVGFINPP